MEDVYVKIAFIIGAFLSMGIWLPLLLVLIVFLFCIVYIVVGSFVDIVIYYGKEFIKFLKGMKK